VTSADLRARLVDALERGGWLRSPRVRDALLATPRENRADRPVSSLLAFGSDAAARILQDHIADWDARGRPGAADLAIDVRYDADGASRITSRWPRPAGA
jgi:hypothetical protein